MRRVRKYNKKLLPRKNYKIIDSSQIKKCHLCRLPGKKDDGIPKHADFNKFFPSTQFASGLSVSLLGEFTHADADIRVQGDYTQPHHQEWNPGDEYIVPPAIKVKRKSHFLAVRVKDVEEVMPINVTVAYPNQGSKEEKAYLKVIHKPTKCNFWHFEIQVWNETSGGEKHYLKDLPAFTAIESTRLLEKYAKQLKKRLIEKIEHSTQIRGRYLPKSIYIEK